MSESAVIAIVVAGILVGGALAIALARRGGGRMPPRRQCGKCQRTMMADWVRCMFCGWQVPTPVPRLEFVCGPLAGQTVSLEEEVTTIGSVAGNTVVLSDPAVSRKHLGIRRVSGRYEFADLGSTNGVYINGHRTGKKTLVTGDIVRVGNTEMVFRVE